VTRDQKQFIVDALHNLEYLITRYQPHPDDHLLLVDIERVRELRTKLWEQVRP
jgi:hypothetical protein